MDQTSLDAALSAYHAEHFDEAANRCRDALAKAPHDVGLLTVLAMAEHAAGKHEAAAGAFRALAQHHPAVPEYWSNLGYMLRLAGRHDEAEQAFIRSLSLAPDGYETLLNYGLLLLDMGRFGAARHRFLDAVEVRPDAAAARIYASSTCFECGDARGAARWIPPEDSWAGLDPDLRRDLAIALTHVGRAQDAERVLTDPASDPADPLTISQLAMLYERTNRLDKAQALLAQIRHRMAEDNELKLHALTVDAALALRARDFGQARTLTLALLELEPPVSVEANANFTLASIADKQGDADEAMRLLEMAHAFQLRMATEIAPDIARSEQEPLRIAMERMRPEQCAFAADVAGPSAEDSPVFIVGFPRSGTTMLEQMLDAHPAYVSMDEQLTLQHCIRQMEDFGFQYPFDLGRLDDGKAEAIRRGYWEEASRIAALGPGQRLVDKNPLNLLRLPMIRRLFPNAHVILALRHPCDVMLSCYMQNFRSPAFMVLCSSLERLARSYVNSMQCWIHHQQLLHADVLVLKYEETVGDFEQQVERIAKFIGIDDPRHLAGFSRHAADKGYISTPSYSQVVEPVNARAVARWRAYRKYFEPVFPILEPVASHWGYRLSPD